MSVCVAIVVFFVPSKDKNVEKIKQVISKPLDVFEPKEPSCEWSKWSECSAECDGGTQTQKHSCDGETRTRSCNLHRCAYSLDPIRKWAGDHDAVLNWECVTYPHIHHRETCYATCENRGKGPILYQNSGVFEYMDGTPVNFEQTSLQTYCDRDREVTPTPEMLPLSVTSAFIENLVDYNG